MCLALSLLVQTERSLQNIINMMGRESFYPIKSYMDLITETKQKSGQLVSHRAYFVDTFANEHFEN